jgi:cell division septum initiation protein DivIVA
VYIGKGIRSENMTDMQPTTDAIKIIRYDHNFMGGLSKAITMRLEEKIWAMDDEYKKLELQYNHVAQKLDEAQVKIKELEKAELMADKLQSDFNQYIKDKENMIDLLKSQLAYMQSVDRIKELDIVKENLQTEIRNSNELFDENMRLKEQLEKAKKAKRGSSKSKPIYTIKKM